jgi:hypothetical protein
MNLGFSFSFLGLFWAQDPRGWCALGKLAAIHGGKDVK